MTYVSMVMWPLRQLGRVLTDSGKAVVSKDITEPGVYAASFTAEPAKEWSRKVARFRRLGQLIERVNKLEKAGK